MYSIYGKIDCIWTTAPQEAELLKKFIQKRRLLKRGVNMSPGDVLTLKWDLSALDLDELTWPIKIGYLIIIKDNMNEHQIKEVAEIVPGNNRLQVKLLCTDTGFERHPEQRKWQWDDEKDNDGMITGRYVEEFEDAGQVEYDPQTNLSEAGSWPA